MARYRLRLKNGRVIGPFDMPQLQELKKKGHLEGDEEAQLFPTGDWMPMQNFPFYAELMDDEKTVFQNSDDSKSSGDGTFLIDLNKLQGKDKPTTVILPSDLPEDNLPKAEELTTTSMLESENKPSPSVEIKLDEHLDLDAGFSIDEPNEEEVLVEEDEKTKINPIAQREIEKLRNKQQQELNKVEIEVQAKKDQEIQRAKEQEAHENIHNELTQVIKLDRHKDSLLEEAQEEEIRVEMAIRDKKNADRIKKNIEDKKEAEENEEEEEPKSNKKKIMIVAALLILLVVLFPEEDKKQQAVFKPLEPVIEFPIPFDKADNNKSKVSYTKGIEKLAKQTYPNKVEAAKDFRIAYENNIENMEALNMMVRTYGDLLSSSSEVRIDTQTLFNIISAKKPYLQDNPNGIIGMALFYYNNGKKIAAANIIDTYIKLKLVLTKTSSELIQKNQYSITQDLFAEQMNILIDLGRMDKAKELYSKLVADATQKKSIDIFIALMKFDQTNENATEAEKKIDEGLDFYPKSVALLLEKATFHARRNEYKEVDEILQKTAQLELENNIIFRARYLELKGLSLAFGGKTEEAMKYLKESLKLRDSDDLRIRLAQLSTSEKLNTEVNNLILESQAMAFLNKAKVLFENKSYELALIQAIRAVDVFPNYIPAQLLTAKLQLKQGLTNSALKSLEELAIKFPESKDANLALIDAYIETFKFNDARNKLTILQGTEIKNSADFLKANARLYIRQNDSLQAIAWLRQAINANPLDDETVFMLAEILLRTHKYDQATTLVNKSIELDPSNPTYRIAYAKIIHETEDAPSAIGYLLSLGTEFPDNPEILAEVAILYYKNGQAKDFQEIKAKLEKLPQKDKTLYLFLVKAALLDEKYDDVPVIVEKLLEVEPGDLESMMTAGRVLFENGKLVEAAKWFLRLQEKLPSYPKLRYFLARIRMVSKEYDKAIEILKEDLKENGENDEDLALLGKIYFEKGELVEAENYFKRTQKINSRSYDALLGMAELSTKRNNLDQALDLYRKAQQQRSDDPTIHKKIGDVYRQLGQGALAIESYKLYLEHNPDSPDKPQIETYIRLMQ